MPSYLIYQIDEEGRIKGIAAEVACNTDEEAIERAGLYVDGIAVEVWDRARLVKLVEPQLSVGAATAKCGRF